MGMARFHVISLDAIFTGLEVWVLFFDEVIEDFGQSKLYRNLLPAKDKPIQFAS